MAASMKDATVGSGASSGVDNAITNKQFAGNTSNFDSTHRFIQWDENSAEVKFELLQKLPYYSGTFSNPIDEYIFNDYDGNKKHARYTAFSYYKNGDPWVAGKNISKIWDFKLSTTQSKYNTIDYSTMPRFVRSTDWYVGLQSKWCFNAANWINYIEKVAADPDIGVDIDSDYFLKIYQLEYIKSTGTLKVQEYAIKKVDKNKMLVKKDNAPESYEINQTNIIVVLQGGGGNGGGSYRYGIGAAGGGSGALCSAIVNLDDTIGKWFIILTGNNSIEQFFDDTPSYQSGGSAVLVRYTGRITTDGNNTGIIVNNFIAACKDEDIDKIVCEGGHAGIYTDSNNAVGKSGGAGGMVDFKTTNSNSKLYEKGYWALNGEKGGGTIKKEGPGEQGEQGTGTEKTILRCSNINPSNRSSNSYWYDHAGKTECLPIGNHSGGIGGSASDESGSNYYSGGAGGAASYWSNGGDGGNGKENAQPFYIVENPIEALGAGGGGGGGGKFGSHITSGAQGGFAGFKIWWGLNIIDQLK